MFAPVAVVVVTWNSASDIDRCLGSAKAESPAEIVVVDNGSTDGTVARARAHGERIQVIERRANTGFAAGCNTGIAATAAPYVLLLNSDAQLERGYVDTLVGALEGDPRAASATGKLVYDDAGARFIDSAGIVLGRHALRPLDRGHGERDAGQFDRAEQIFGPSGAAALFRREALAPMTGPFDEDLFAYYEDVDLAWRLSRLGWHHLYVPRAIAFHRRRTAASKPNEIAARAFANRYLVWLKNESAARLLTYGWLAGPWEAARLVRRAMHEPTLLSGIPHAMRLIPAMLRKRRTRGRD
jgi:GT2 family glycosyltransferase